MCASLFPHPLIVCSGHDDMLKLKCGTENIGGSTIERKAKLRKPLLIQNHIIMR